jgi:LPS-assembly protein
MKNNFFLNILVFFIFFNLNLASQELEVNSSIIKYDDINKITIFEGSVNSMDEKGNKLFSEYAEYNKVEKLFETKGKTKILTSGGYELIGSNIILNEKKKIIYSDYKAKIKDKDGNEILVDMFSYSTLNSIFFSKGNIRVLDINNNTYNFSEVYIDETKKKIIGSDVKAFLNLESVSANINNEPRIFANTMSLSDNINTMDKGILTYCKEKKDEECPPWVLQSKKIKHDLAKKTIFYENVVLKIYDFPIFFAPRFSHPDPTVKRRSGLLVPSLTSSTSLGSGFSVPYFLNLSNDRDLTITPKLYLNENPLLLAEYRQDFKNSFLVFDTGYTKGYKKTNKIKTKGNRAHFFSKFNMSLIDNEEKNSRLEVNIQKTSNDTYFKIYDVDTLLVKKEQNILENNIAYKYQNKDFYFDISPSIFEDIDKTGHLRNEYLLPLNIEKNIMNHKKYGFMNIESNLRVRNYETNKKTEILVNNFNWKSNKWLSKLGIENHFEGLVKAVNYKANKTVKYKNEKTNSELHPVLGYFAKLGLSKNDIINKNVQTLTPRLLLRYAPGHMRAAESGRLSYNNLFSINKVNELDIVENGLSASIGFDYKKNQLDKDNNINTDVMSFSLGQVISGKENMDIPSSTSLDQKFSDVVGKSKYYINDKVNLNYNFSIDQSYKNFNYNEIETNFNFEKAKFNISYLQEKNHIGNQEYIDTGADYKINNSGELSFSAKRNLLTNSAEFYKLSYNYINDCLKAGLAYRREFYTDRDVEPTNRLLFTISVLPFGQIRSPSINGN